VHNGLSGRLLRLPGPRPDSGQILLVYGVHSSLERMYSTAEFLSSYGSVTLPDLPGLGGMDSFYRTGRQPTLDNYADYLFSLLQELKLRPPVKVVAMSFGFLVVTRMLQRHPEARRQFGHVISFVGFGRSSDFRQHRRQRWLFGPICWLFSTRLGGWLISRGLFNRVGLKIMFAVFQTFNPKYKHGMATDPTGSLQMELDLWRKNEARTRFFLYRLLFNFDLTGGRDIIALPLHNMTTPTDQYFDSAKVAESLRRLYRPLSESAANMSLHAPSIIGTTEEVAEIFSDAAKAVLKAKR
jgi:pimeloyl-ACP methyl ester carboxylesterase